MIILEKDQNLAGGHFRVTWELFEGMLRGEVSALLGSDEYIHAVRFEGEQGVLICIRNKDEGTE